MAALEAGAAFVVLTLIPSEGGVSLLRLALFAVLLLFFAFWFYFFLRPPQSLDRFSRHGFLWGAALLAVTMPVSAQAGSYGGSRYYPEDAILDWSGERFTITRIDSFEPTDDERLRLESWMQSSPDRIEALQEDSLEAARPEDVELRLDLERAIEALPEGHREAILLFYYCELSVAETAAQLGISREAAKVRLHRGRALIRERLAGPAPGKETT